MDSLDDYTRKLDNKAEADGKTDTCDYCKVVKPWKELQWLGQTSVRHCGPCTGAAKADWEEHCAEMKREAEAEREAENEDWY